MNTRPLAPGLAFAATLLLFGLGACSSAPDDTVEDNDAGYVAEPPVLPSSDRSETTESRPSASADVNTAAEVAPALPDADVSADDTADAPVDDQVMDDASATGMTSRSSRGERSTTDETSPDRNESE